MRAFDTLPAIGLLCALAVCGGSSTAIYTAGVNVSVCKADLTLTNK